MGNNFLKSAKKLFGFAKSALSEYGQNGIDSFESGEIKPIATFCLLQTPMTAIMLGTVVAAGLTCLACGGVQKAFTGGNKKPKVQPKQPAPRPPAIQNIPPKVVPKDTSYLDALERGKQSYQAGLPKSITMVSNKLDNETDPMPYWEPGENEKYETIKCQHVGCEGTGSFVFSRSHKMKYQQYGNSMPKTCYDCKVWMFQHQSLLGIEGYCENPRCRAHNLISPHIWIGYHKFTGKPTFQIFCRVCNSTHSQLEKHTKKYGDIPEKYQNHGYVGIILKELDASFRGDVEFYTRMKKFILENKSVTLPELLSVNSESFHEISPTHEYHNPDGSLRTRKKVKGKKGKPRTLKSLYESRRDHIGHHAKEFAGVQTTNNLIHFLHQSRDSKDRTRFIDIPQKNGSIMRCDCKLFTVAIYSVRSGKGFVSTAYQPKHEEIRLNKKLKKKTQKLFLQYLQSKVKRGELIIK